MSDLINELRTTAKKALEGEIKNKPQELRNRILERIKEYAQGGCYEINWRFGDRDDIIDRTLDLLKKDGFKITKVDYGNFQISWR